MLFFFVVVVVVGISLVAPSPSLPPLRRPVHLQPAVHPDRRHRGHPGGQRGDGGRVRHLLQAEAKVLVKEGRRSCASSCASSSCRRSCRSCCSSSSAFAALLLVQLLRGDPEEPLQPAPGGLQAEDPGAAQLHDQPAEGGRGLLIR